MNKKIKIILMIFLGIISLTMISGCEKGKRVVKDFPTVVNSLDSYKVTGKLYSNFPSGTKESLVTVYYQKPDFFRVEIDNADLKDKQIVIRNKDGVEILIPSVNKTFKVKSSWPLNSSYPYLFQSLSKDMLNDSSPITTLDEETSTTEIKAKVFENAAPTTQKIVFSNKTGYPMEVLMYDENHNLLTRFVYEKIEINQKLEDSLFDTPKTLESMREYLQDIVDSYVRTITYPTYYPAGVTLKEELISGTDLKTAIMKYDGTESFTIIQQYLMSSDTMTTTYIDGDIYLMGGSVAVIGKNNIFFGEQGMEYTIASSTMNVIEMIKMGDSLLVGSEK